MIQYYKYTFICEGINASGEKDVIEQYYVHQTEEEARRGLIHTLTHLFHFYPKNLKLNRINKWESSLFLFD